MAITEKFGQIDFIKRHQQIVESTFVTIVIQMDIVVQIEGYGPSL